MHLFILIFFFWCKLLCVTSKVFMNRFGVYLLCTHPNVFYSSINLGNMKFTSKTYCRKTIRKYSEIK